MFSSSGGNLRRIGTVAAAFSLSIGGLVMGSLMLLPAAPASADVPCGNTGVFGVSGQTGTCTYQTVGADTFTVPP
ncbi:MAG TPA: hypothetical protein VIY26_00985, partial [Acidimicrobiales bacterium]